MDVAARNVCPDCNAVLSVDEMVCPHCLTRLPLFKPEQSSYQVKPISFSPMEQMRLRLQMIRWSKIALLAGVGLVLLLVFGGATVAAWTKFDPRSASSEEQLAQTQSFVSAAKL